MNNFHRFQNFRQFSNLFSQIWLKKRHTSLFSGICREIRTNFHKKFAEKCKIRRRKWKVSEIQLFNREKMLAISYEKIEISDGARNALCRSRRELSNEYLLEKFGFDTAENEPYYFVSSSSRELEFELWNFEQLICNPDFIRVLSRQWEKQGTVERQSPATRNPRSSRPSSSARHLLDLVTVTGIFQKMVFEQLEKTFKKDQEVRNQ